MPATTPCVPRPLPIITLVIWSACATVGGLGLGLRYPWPHARQVEPPPVVAQMAVVELPREEPKPEVPQEPTAAPSTTDRTPAPEAGAETRAPTAPPPLAMPDAPAFTPVAPPTAAVAFAVPVAGPTRVVATAQAAPNRLTGSPHGAPGGAGTTPSAGPAGPAAGPRAQTLVMGQGEGNQEAPAYPREALRRRQEGTVVVRLEVNEQGEVTSAEVAQACDHPLLNHAALRTVQRAWHFPAGPRRLYQVSIKFVLQ